MQSADCKVKNAKVRDMSFVCKCLILTFTIYNLQFAICTEYSLDIQKNLDGVQ